MKENDSKGNGLKPGLVEGNLVEEFMIGNTKIKIYDGSYRDKTPEEIDAIIKRIENIGRRALYKQALREMEGS